MGLDGGGILSCPRKIGDFLVFVVSYKGVLGPPTSGENKGYLNP